MKITNFTKSVIHLGEVALQPGINDVEEEIKAKIESSAFFKSFFAHNTDYVSSGFTDTTEMAAANAVKYVTTLTDKALLNAALTAEKGLKKVRSSVINAITARLSDLEAAEKKEQDKTE
jgi:hypothetical protein